MKGFDTNKHIREILSEGEIQQLEAFNQNPMMQEAVRKVLLLPIYSMGTLQKGKPANPQWNFALGFVSSDSKLKDDEVGRYLKIQNEGITAIQVAFERLAQFRASDEISPKENPAI